MAFNQRMIEEVAAWCFNSAEMAAERMIMNIWNNTPQPDRGGKTANQMMESF